MIESDSIVLYTRPCSRNTPVVVCRQKDRNLHRSVPSRSLLYLRESHGATRRRGKVCLDVAICEVGFAVMGKSVCHSDWPAVEAERRGNQCGCTLDEHGVDTYDKHTSASVKIANTLKSYSYTHGNLTIDVAVATIRTQLFLPFATRIQ